MASIGAALILTISPQYERLPKPSNSFRFYFNKFFFGHRQIFTNKHQKTATKITFFHGSIEVALVGVIHLNMVSGANPCLYEAA
jgi:hypothetical protein